MLRNMVIFLSKPFPQEESFLVTVKIITAISVFVTLFLYIFKPFGIHLIEANSFLLCVGFGVVTFVASFIYELMVVKIFKVKGAGIRFTYGRWVLYFVGVMVFISLANFIFIRLVLFDDIQWSLYPAMMRGTFAVGIFPTMIVGALALLGQEKKYQNIAEEINDSKGRLFKLNEHTGSPVFDIASKQIRYIEAMQNYVNIGYLDTANQWQVRTERATLKSLLDGGLDDAIVQCHRSYLVNRDNIVSVSGNAQGLLLTLNHCDKSIPVSRSFVMKFRS